MNLDADAVTLPPISMDLCRPWFMFMVIVSRHPQTRGISTMDRVLAIISHFSWAGLSGEECHTRHWLAVGVKYGQTNSLVNQRIACLSTLLGDRQMKIMNNALHSFVCPSNVGLKLRELQGDVCFHEKITCSLPFFSRFPAPKINGAPRPTYLSPRSCFASKAHIID